VPGAASNWPAIKVASPARTQPGLCRQRRDDPPQSSWVLNTVSAEMIDGAAHLGAGLHMIAEE
jgi:hypothetical protein